MNSRFTQKPLLELCPNSVLIVHFVHFKIDYASGIEINLNKGAVNTFYLATSKDVENVTGKYFSNKKVAKPSTKYYSQEDEKIVWDYCMQIAKTLFGQIVIGKLYSRQATNYRERGITTCIINGGIHLNL